MLTSQQSNRNKSIKNSSKSGKGSAYVHARSGKGPRRVLAKCLYHVYWLGGCMPTFPSHRGKQYATVTT